MSLDNNQNSLHQMAMT